MKMSIIIINALYIQNYFKNYYKEKINVCTEPKNKKILIPKIIYLSSFRT